MKNIRKIFIRIIIAGLIEFILLNVVCLFYYNLPSRTANETNATDYKWASGSLFCRATEGVGYGKINDDGFNNAKDLSEIDSIDVLMMGSSHLEGFNVPQKDIISEVMNSLTDSFYSYNIGISGHSLMTCFDNLDAALSYYNPTKYVVFETMTVSFYDGQVNDYLNGTRTREAAFDSKLMNIAQRIPVFRLLASQLNNLNNNNNGDDGVATLEAISSRELVGAALKKVSSLCEANGVTPVIFYHPTLNVTANGVTENTITVDKDLFKSLCDENDIVFVDMGPVFTEHYNKTHELPHGFVNTTIGSGHLNAVGHHLIGQELVRVLNGLEENK